jgi:4-amino-4-deoxy-L-arabinose transferase-like glycosyltransferase
VLAFALYAAGVPDNPPGFHIDESSVAYNAHLITQSGRDEYGEEWPLHFRSLGDYKSPAYVYLLAAVFRVTGPGVAAARYLSACLGVLAALALGLMGLRLTGSRAAGLLTFLTALLTPWLFGLSRVAVEVAAYPLAVTLFLLSTRRASSKEAWGLADSAFVAAALALVTYTYSTGRLYGPLLALGLALLATKRARVRPLLTTWLLYGLALVPLYVYHRRHPEALTQRFSYMTYITPESGYAEVAWEFVRHFLGNLNPWRMVITGDVNEHQIATVPGAAPILFATFALALFGARLALKEARGDAWWRLFSYGLIASVIPASLTKDYFHAPRLAALPVFLVALCAPAFARLAGGKRMRGALYASFVLLVAQGAYSQWRFHARPPERWQLFDARFPRKVLAPALAAARSGRIYLYDPPGNSGYIQPLWHGVLGGVDPSRYVRLGPGEAPPPGAVVISTEDRCDNCSLLARHVGYTLYAVEPTDLKVTGERLPPEGLRADITSPDLPRSLGPGERRILKVTVRNLGGVSWPAVGEKGRRYAASLRHRWLKADGSPFAVDEWREYVYYDVEPGDSIGLWPHVTAPETPGDYILEFDMTQEGVMWFGAHGSKPLRAPVKVLPGG